MRNGLPAYEGKQRGDDMRQLNLVENWLPVCNSAQEKQLVSINYLTILKAKSF